MSVLVELPESEYNLNAFAQFVPTGGFSIGTALAMAWMSQLAYETRLPDKISAIGARFGLTKIRILRRPAKTTLPLSDTRGIIADKDDALIIAFAGTDPLNLLNWVSDFYVGRPDADVHEGFQDAAAAVWPEVGAAIERCVQDQRPLFVVGHSLGAAIALATVDRAQREKSLKSAQVFVFGAPRYGRADFVAKYNAAFGATTYRLVHGRDIVATVPPSEFGFRHVGRYLSCKSGAKFDPAQLHATTDSDEPSSGSDFFSGIAARLRDFVGRASLT